VDRLLNEFLNLLPLLLVGGVLYFAVLSLVTLWLITHPPRRTYSWAVSRGRPGDPGEMDSPRAFTEQDIETLGCSLSVWEIPGDAPEGPVVYVSPGWGHSKIGVLIRMGPLLPRCSRVIAIDSPGVGETPGWCLLGLREGALLERLVRDTAGDSPVVLMGWSMGGGVSIEAATKLAQGEGLAQGESPVRVLGVIAEAAYRRPITPASAVMGLQGLPWKVNLRLALWALGIFHRRGPGWKNFDREPLAAKLACPLLLLHGEDDPVSPIADAREIAEAAPDATLVETPGGSHSDLWMDDEFRPAQADSVTRFLDRILG
jgi:pimeloyl-ACP methyl ester carboxylesterase